MRMYIQYLELLDQIKRHHADRLSRQFQLHCETGDWLDSAVLKLQKSNWSDHGMREGIFFSVWLGDSDIQKKRFNYNIHALKLGSQKCFNVKPVAFAKSFRSRFESDGWPNVGVDHGPQTLMQGWLPLHLNTFSQDVVGLIERFSAMHPLLDELLDS